MTTMQVIKMLVYRESELQKTRTRALVNQKWATVIATDAKIEECALTRKTIAEFEQPASNASHGAEPPTAFLAP